MTNRTQIEGVEEQAALFALGALESEEARRFRQRLASGCPLCLSEVQDCENALAALALSARPVAPASSVRTRLLETIGAVEEERGSQQGSLVRAEEVPWKPSPFAGVEMRYLLERKTMMVRMAPKSRIPAHPHSAGEQCLVLEGSVTSNGVTAFAGDFTYMPPGSSHDDLYSEDGALFLITYA